MNCDFHEIDVKWLDLRIAETQQQMQYEKNQLRKSEGTGLNTSTSCRSLAATAKHLEMLKARKMVVLNKLNLEDSAAAWEA